MIPPDQAGSGPIEPLRHGEGASILGARNPAREAQARDQVRPPGTDKGSLPNLPWSFADSHNRLEPGVWAREATVRELPVSTAMAGVNMRLDAGGVREMHRHKTAKWSCMLASQARITSVDEEGRTFQDDVGVGDLWYFPPGIPHSIRGLGAEGVEFLLVFDDGAFSFQAGDVGYVPFAMGHCVENTDATPVRFLEVFASDRDADVSLSQWMALTPHALVAANLGLDRALLNATPAGKHPVVSAGAGA